MTILAAEREDLIGRDRAGFEHFHYNLGDWRRTVVPPLRHFLAQAGGPTFGEPCSLTPPDPGQWLWQDTAHSEWSEL